MKEIKKIVKEYSSELIDNGSPVSIILAAGHGKRIKSEKPKMIHEIWGVPTVVRVSDAAREGLNSNNQVVVVGIKADQVVKVIGEKEGLVYAFQEKQMGTGHAVMTALEVIKKLKRVSDIYIFPGDMGLITSDIVREFKDAFEKSNDDMFVLTGLFTGDPEENMYGRIIRVPEINADGKSTGEYFNRVIAIKEQKDINAMPENYVWEVRYKGFNFRFDKNYLKNIREFNTGVYAVKFKPLINNIERIIPDNVQKEYYLTDLIGIFNNNGLKVGAQSASDDTTVIGFNVKSVLKKMEQIYRQKVWMKLRDIIIIEDDDDFFIADEVIDDIIKMDKNNGPLDIFIGKGVYISSGVRLNKRVEIRSGAKLTGNIEVGEGTIIEENVSMSTYPNQYMKIGKDCIIMRGDMIKGRVEISDNSRIESGVNITGSDEYPVYIGKNVTIKGTTYIFGCIIEDNLFIEHSVLKCKLVERIVRKDGGIQPVRWIMPQPQGLDVLKDISKNNK